MYVFTYVWVYVLVKRKLTLSVDGELLREVKSLLVRERVLAVLLRSFLSLCLGLGGLMVLLRSLGLGVWIRLTRLRFLGVGPPAWMLVGWLGS